MSRLVDGAVAAVASPHSVISRYRWVICALLFFATTINYVDRAVLGVLAPTLVAEFGWSERDYGVISASFTLAYAIGFLFAGWFIDRVGTRLGYGVYLTVWSIAAAAHALVNSVAGFSMMRFALGLGESGNFPAAVKTVAEWFPKRERALATGIFNAGSNIGAIVAPLVVPWLALTWGWRTAFVVTGLTGLVWLAFWWPMYRRPAEHPKVSPAELALIESDPPDPPVRASWLQLLRFRQTWAFTAGKFLSDSVWWFYLFWFPMFLADRFGVDLRTIGLPMVTVFLLADVGSVGGGWFSSFLMKRGWTANAARKTAMLLCALCILPVVFAPHVEAQWAAVWLIGLAAAAHQGFSANLFTLTSDMFPRAAVASVVGIGGFAGAMGGFFMNLGAGWLRQTTGSYAALFLMAGGAYLAALLVIHVLAPRLAPAQLDRAG
ncbi:MFS transporter [Lysobacteraceae bacterium NML93-0792]|nr:MFS transporter [Xanthomonadaceae bacterium NML93-0792]PBS17206.1 MFS transporter [Xanthomonadaceae bacterium NML93-0793]PBS19851.1 MFS transporter [Xanthomonadaceae bacterium NML93-0831]